MAVRRLRLVLAAARLRSCVERITEIDRHDQHLVERELATSEARRVDVGHGVVGLALPGEAPAGEPAREVFEQRRATRLGLGAAGRVDLTVVVELLAEGVGIAVAFWRGVPVRDTQILDERAPTIGALFADGLGHAFPLLAWQQNVSDYMVLSVLCQKVW